MTPPEMLDESASSLPSEPAWSDRVGIDASLRTELVHRHLAARVGVAQEQLQILEDHSPSPEALVVRFGATIIEAQRVLDAERAEVAERAELRQRDTEARAVEIVRRAKAEAAAIREVASQLRSTSEPVRSGDDPSSVAGVPATPAVVTP